MKASPGYPIPHKSLAVGWGFREAWQNGTIKQEQTSHTSPSVSYVKASGRQNRFYIRYCQCIFPMHCFFKTAEISLSFLLKRQHPHMRLSICLPHTWHHTTFQSAYDGFQVYATGRKQGTLCAKMLTHLCGLQSSLWSDSKRMRAARCQKAVNYTCGGQIWARHRGRCGLRCHVFRR